MNTDQLVSDALAAHEASLAAQAIMQEQANLRNELILKALEAGAGAIAVAEAFGVERQRIYQMAKAAK